ADGVAEITVELDPAFELGGHSLHVTGVNPAGEQIFHTYALNVIGAETRWATWSPLVAAVAGGVAVLALLVAITARFLDRRYQRHLSEVARHAGEETHDG